MPINRHTFWYLASPYSAHPGGLVQAHAVACGAVAKLLRRHVRVFSPIAHFHEVAKVGRLDPRDHAIWGPANEAFIDAAGGMIEFRALGWASSKGLIAERAVFQRDGKPIEIAKTEDFTDAARLEELLRRLDSWTR